MKPVKQIQMSPGQIMDAVMKKICDTATVLGASDVGLILPGTVVVENRLVAYCTQPGCPGYNRSMSCPPHVEGPDWFREYVARVVRVLVFKLDVETSVLMSRERQSVIRRLHGMAAALERMSVESGFRQTRGFAGGSCKQAFCSDHDECRVLSGSGSCRYPDQARQSMSGMGVNVGRLAQTLGWEMNIITEHTDPAAVPMGMMVGLVCLG